MMGDKDDKAIVPGTCVEMNTQRTVIECSTAHIQTKGLDERG